MNPEQYTIIIVTAKLTQSQMRRLDKRLEDFEKENRDLLDRISLNKKVEGQL